MTVSNFVLQKYRPPGTIWPMVKFPGSYFSMPIAIQRRCRCCWRTNHAPSDYSQPQSNGQVNHFQIPPSPPPAQPLPVRPPITLRLTTSAWRPPISAVNNHPSNHSPNPSPYDLHALACNLSNFIRTLALTKEVEHLSLTTLRKKLVKIGAKVVRHGRYVSFQMAEVAVPRSLYRKKSWH